MIDLFYILLIIISLGVIIKASIYIGECNQLIKECKQLHKVCEEQIKKIEKEIQESYD